MARTFEPIASVECRKELSIMNPIVEASGLTKRFGRVQALAGLDLVVRSGRVAAFRNAGASTNTVSANAAA